MVKADKPDSSLVNEVARVLVDSSYGDRLTAGLRLGDRSVLSVGAQEIKGFLYRYPAIAFAKTQLVIALSSSSRVNSGKTAVCLCVTAYKRCAVIQHSAIKKLQHV